MTIPASYLVGAFPSVVTGGGNALQMKGLFLTQSSHMPNWAVYNFTSTKGVVGFFGAASPEVAASVIYFAGYNNATVKPGGMLFASYNSVDRAAFLRSGSLAGVSLAQLEALTGVLSIVVDGVTEISANINLSGATSFTNAATLILAGFTAPLFSVAWDAVSSAFVFTTTLAGAGATITFATGTLAAGLYLTSATGAFVSQGGAADTPATAMTRVAAISQNWFTLVTLWEPTLTDKQNFAAWFNAQNAEYFYPAWDSDPNASVQGNTTCFGALATAANYTGVAAISGDPALAVATGSTLAALALNAAIFVAGAIASINFATANGRRSIAFLSGAIAATCADAQIAANLVANGYSYYGSFATANQGFQFLYNGQMFGPWKSLVRYVNQAWINSQFQLGLMTLLTQSGVDYSPAGYGLIRNTLQSPIEAAVTFGAIRRNVTLSAVQIAQVNQQAGVNAANVIQTDGYYLQILDPGSAARTNGQSPIVNFWYADGGDVLQINLASIAVL